MKQRYKSKIYDLKNQLAQLNSSSDSKVTVSKHTVAIPANPSQSVIEEPIFEKSHCAKNPQEKAYFKEIMGNRKFRTVIKYKGSRDGWMPADFHRMSDKKGPTVTLFKIKDNKECVGGFTSA